MNSSVYESLDRNAYRRRRNKIRRMRLIRRRCILLAFTVVLVLVLSLSYHAISSEANTGEESKFKYYTSIEVKYGDTLWSIAEDYLGSEYTSAKDYIHEVMEINHLKDEFVSAGQYLVIPYYSTEFK